MKKGDICICDAICLANGLEVEITDIITSGLKTKVEYKILNKDNMGFGEIGSIENMLKEDFLKYFTYKEE